MILKMKLLLQRGAHLPMGAEWEPSGANMEMDMFMALAIFSEQFYCKGGVRAKMGAEWEPSGIDKTMRASLTSAFEAHLAMGAEWELSGANKTHTHSRGSPHPAASKHARPAAKWQNYFTDLAMEKHRKGQVI